MISNAPTTLRLILLFDNKLRFFAFMISPAIVLFKSTVTDLASTLCGRSGISPMQLAPVDIQGPITRSLFQNPSVKRARVTGFLVAVRAAEKQSNYWVWQSAAIARRSSRCEIREVSTQQQAGPIC